MCGIKKGAPTFCALCHTFNQRACQIDVMGSLVSGHGVSLPSVLCQKKEGLLQREGQCNSPEIALHEKRKIIPTAAVLCDGSDVQLTAADVPVDYNGSAF